jgi:serine/threonine protein kinase
MQRYQFLAEVAEDQVYKVLDKETGETLALKRDGWGDLKDEAEALRQMGNHDNIARFHTLLENGTILVLDYCEYDLTGVLTNLQIPKNQIIDMMVQILRGVERIHERGYIHCDLKPDNILVNKKGIVKITDFGSATEAGVPTQPDKGDILYRAPEILERANDERCDFSQASDIWAIGCVFYFMMTKTPLFVEQVFRATPEGDEWWFLKGIMNKFAEPIKLPPEYSFMLPLLLRMISLQPEMRPTASELLQMDPFLSGGVRVGITLTEVHQRASGNQVAPWWMTGQPEPKRRR